MRSFTECEHIYLFFSSIDNPMTKRHQRDREREKRRTERNASRADRIDILTAIFGPPCAHRKRKWTRMDVGRLQSADLGSSWPDCKYFIYIFIVIRICYFGSKILVSTTDGAGRRKTIFEWKRVLGTADMQKVFVTNRDGRHINNCRFTSTLLWQILFDFSRHLAGFMLLPTITIHE